MATRICGGPGGGRPCPTGQLIEVRPGSKTAARCSPCRTQWQQAKDQRRPDRRSHAEQQRRRRAVAGHVARHGWWCLGHPSRPDHRPHPTRDLTAHHVGSVGAGGSEHGPLAVVCRSLNSTIGAKTN
jgi:hypothetical protein